VAPRAPRCRQRRAKGGRQWALAAGHDEITGTAVAEPNTA
jgi:hypothetical protein